MSDRIDIGDHFLNKLLEKLGQIDKHLGVFSERMDHIQKATEKNSESIGQIQRDVANLGKKMSQDIREEIRIIVQDHEKKIIELEKRLEGLESNEIVKKGLKTWWKDVGDYIKLFITFSTATGLAYALIQFLSKN